MVFIVCMCPPVLTSCCRTGDSDCRFGGNVFVPAVTLIAPTPAPRRNPSSRPSASSAPQSSLAGLYPRALLTKCASATPFDAEGFCNLLANQSAFP